MSNDSHLVEYVDDIDKKHEDAHGRLRETLNSQKVTIDSNYEYFRGRIETLQKQSDQAAKDIDRLGSAPVNIDKLIFTPRVVLTVLGFLLSIWTFFYATTGSLRADASSLHSDIRDVLTRMDAQKSINDSRATLQDVQQQSIRNDVDTIKRQLQLEQYEIQNLKDLINAKPKKGS